MNTRTAKRILNPPMIVVFGLVAATVLLIWTTPVGEHPLAVILLADLIAIILVTKLFWVTVGSIRE